MKKKSFLLVKNYCFKKIKKINIKELKGFSFKPRNKNKDRINVDTVVMFNASFTETILKKKIKNRLEIYLRFIISLLDSDNDSDITGLRAALNDLTRYKAIIQNKYLKYLDERYSAMLLKKIGMLEDELKKRIITYNPMQYMDDEMKEEHRRSR